MPAGVWTRVWHKSEGCDAYSRAGHTLLGVGTVLPAAVILMVPGTQQVFRRSCDQTDEYSQEGRAAYCWRG